MVMLLMPRHPSDSLSPVAGGSPASKSGELVYLPFIIVLLPRTGGPSLHRLRTCFSAIATFLSKQQPWIEACSSPASQRIFPLHLLLSLHRSGITTRPTSPYTYFHDDRGISHERVSESELQTAEKTDVLPIQRSHDTISFLALGGLHEDKFMRHFTRSNDTCQCETVYETSLFHIESNLDRLRLCLPIRNQRSQYQSGQNTLQSVSQGHTSILRFMMEALSWRSRRASQNPPVQSLVLPPKLARTSLFAPCNLVSRQGFSRPTPPRPAHLPIPK